MDQQNFNTSVSPEVTIEAIMGSLTVKGWDRPEVNIRANPDDLKVEEKDDGVWMTCQGDCTVRLPHSSSLKVETVHGEAGIKLLDDPLSIGQVHGSLTLRNVAETQVERVHGELYAKNVQGDLQISEVMGNAIIRAVQNHCILESVQGNADVRDVEANLQLAAQGNVRVRLRSLSGTQYEIEAGGNANVRVPKEASLKLTLTSDAEAIRVRIAGESKNYRQQSCELVLGDGEAEMKISAGGPIFFDCDVADWGDTEEEEPGAGGRFAGEFDRQVAQQIEAQIEAQMQAMTRQINEQMANLSAMMGRVGMPEDQAEKIMQRARESSERAAARAQERVQRAQEKLERKMEAARRREEIKAQANERRTQTSSKRSWGFNWGPTPPAPPAPPKEPVSDEERLMILKMLEQKKISIQEAEQLLAALEGKES